MALTKILRGGSFPAGTDDGRNPAPAINMSEPIVSAAEDHFNRRLDAHVRVLARALDEAVDLARVGSKDRCTVAQEELQIHHLATSILHAANGIATLATDIKQLLLLGDVATRHALADRRVATVDRVVRDHRRTLGAICGETGHALALLDQTLGDHCAAPKTAAQAKQTEAPLLGAGQPDDTAAAAAVSVSAEAMPMEGLMGGVDPADGGVEDLLATSAPLGLPPSSDAMQSLLG